MFIIFQVFHICQERERKDSFLCPNGTIFSQRFFVCVWWYEFDCSSAPGLYQLNYEIGKEEEEGPYQYRDPASVSSYSTCFKAINRKIKAPKYE